jgi:hypothetical protein
MKDQASEASHIGRGGLALLLLALSLNIDAQPERGSRDLQQRRPTPQEIYREIKNIAREAVAPDSPLEASIFDVIQFRTDRESTVIAYRVGPGEGNFDIPDFYFVLVGAGSGEPYALPIRKQVYVEALDRLFREELPNKPFWNTNLRNAERFIQLTIADIQAKPEGAERQRLLAEREKQINEQFRQLWATVIQDHCRRVAGYDCVDSRGGASPNAFFEVHIKIDPPDGVVKALSEFTHRFYRQKPREQWPWETLRAGTKEMIGKYYFLAEWPDSRNPEELIEVSDDITLTFTPRQIRRDPPRTQF